MKTKDLIGPAAQILQDCRRVVARRRQQGNGTYILLYGPPGCGKSTIARMLTREFSGLSETAERGAAEVDVDAIQHWHESARARAPFQEMTRLSVVIDEVDKLHHTAKESLSQLYDAVSENPHQLLIGTSNADPAAIAIGESGAKLRNRFALAFFVDRPTDAEISKLLQDGGLDRNAADSIAAVSDGVRDAELRADMT